MLGLIIFQGRLFTTKERVQAQFNTDEVSELTPCFNIPPSFPVLFLVQLSPNERQVITLQWGLVPYWSNNKKKMIANARCENLTMRSAFRNSFRLKRGIMIVNGFFEWHAHSNHLKQPYYFKQADDDLLAIASLWDTWQSNEGEVIHSCALITTGANPLMAPIHFLLTVGLIKR